VTLWLREIFGANARVQRARAVDSTQVNTPDRGLRLQPFVYARHGHELLGLKSPVRDWESQGDQYTK
jgi:hypothetical protein